MKTLTLLLLTAAALSADTLTFTTLPADFENNTYNGFVSGTDNGVPFSDLVCDDYSHTTIVPSGPLDYHVGSLNDLSFARFTASQYRWEALLIAGDGTAALPGLAHASASQVAGYQYAIWGITNGSVGAYGGSGALLSYVAALNVADPKYKSIFDSLRIYTPIGAGNQEFLSVGGAPEPAGLLLMVSGLAALAWRRRTAR